MDIKRLRVAALPVSAKIIVTTFLVIIGAGYMHALGNLYYRHHLADGKPDLSLDDLRITFQGMKQAIKDSGHSQGTKSRMLRMVEPGGKMRKHLDKGGDASVRALVGWLSNGATEAAFSTGGVPQAGDPSPRAVLERQCLRCHNAEDGERKKSPFGKDSFDAEFAMVNKYTVPGTDALGTRATSEPSAEETEFIPPQSVDHLFLITHVHMLSIPVFALIVAMLFYCTGLSPRLRGVLAPIPMITLLVDFSSWWIARVLGPAVYMIAAAGAVFGVTFCLQILTILLSMWFVRRDAFRDQQFGYTQADVR